MGDAQGQSSNFAKLHKLLDHLSSILRSEFCKRWKYFSRSDWDSHSVDQFITGVGKNLYENCGRLQKKVVESGDVTQWDITLLTDALLQTNFKKARGFKGKQEPLLLQDLKKVRNTLFHHHSNVLDTSKFTDLWDRSVKVLNFYGGSVDKDNLTNSSSQQSTNEDSPTANTALAMENLVSVAEQIRKFQRESEFAVGNCKVEDVIHHANTILPGIFDNIEARKLMNSGNFKGAATLFTKSANLGNAEGLYKLALLHKTGQGVPKDLKLYIELLKEAASKPNTLPDDNYDDDLPNFGSAEAELELGLAYDDGYGVQQDFVEAARWYDRASQHGMAVGSNNLAYMYSRGQGVPVSLKRSAHYLSVAVAQGHTVCMQPLAFYYLKEGDLLQALEWHYRAVQNEVWTEEEVPPEMFQAMVNQSGIDKDQSMYIRLQSEIEACADGQIALDNVEKTLSKILFATANDRRIFYEIYKSETSDSTFLASYTFKYAELQRYAKGGSKTAARLVKAKEKYLLCMTMLNGDFTNSKKERTVLVMLFINDLAESYRLASVVVQLPPNLKMLIDFFVMFLMEGFSANGSDHFDKAWRLCSAHLTPSTTLNETLDFVGSSKKMYPQEVAFHQLQVDLCASLGQYEKGLRSAEKALKLFKNHEDLLYSVAFHKRKSYKSTASEIISAYKNFLAHAEYDHPNVPEAYYAIAHQHSLAFKENSDKKFMPGKPQPKVGVVKSESLNHFALAEEFYRKGIEAEEKQLPCYLPYKSEHKKIVGKTSWLHAEKSQLSI